MATYDISGNYCTTASCGGVTANPKLTPFAKWYENVSMPSTVRSAWDIASQAFNCGGGGTNPYIAEVENLKELKKQFAGPEATYIRWMIDNKITSLYRTANSISAGNESAKYGTRINLGQAEKAAMESNITSQSMQPVTGQEGIYHGSGVTYGATGQPTWTPSAEYIAQAGTPGQARIDTAKKKLASAMEGFGGTYQEKNIPIPDWMVPYLETSINYEAPEGVQQGNAPTLRPMGAQAELTPTQLGQMAGYEAYTRAGAPSNYSEEALTAMSDWEQWWQPYTTLSQSLFPSKNKLTPRWMPALQR